MYNINLKPSETIFIFTLPASKQIKTLFKYTIHFNHNYFYFFYQKQQRYYVNKYYHFNTLHHRNTRISFLHFLFYAKWISCSCLFCHNVYSQKG